MNKPVVKSYIMGVNHEGDEIEVGKCYQLGELYSGDCDLEEILDSGSLAYEDDNYFIIDFEVLVRDKYEPLNSSVRVTYIF